MNLSTKRWAQWDKTQSRELLCLFICVCSSRCTIVAHNTPQNRPDNFPSCPPDNHRCSDDVYLREGGGLNIKRKDLVWILDTWYVSAYIHQSVLWGCTTGGLFQHCSSSTSILHRKHHHRHRDDHHQTFIVRLLRTSYKNRCITTSLVKCMNEKAKIHGRVTKYKDKIKRKFIRHLLNGKSQLN